MDYEKYFEILVENLVDGVPKDYALRKVMGYESMSYLRGRGVLVDIKL